MKKIVINGCYGGFSLSHRGVIAYAKKKGITLYPEKSRLPFPDWTYWTVPLEERLTQDETEWENWTTEQRMQWNAAYQAQTLSNRDIPRDDPALVAVVEELSKLANGRYASLYVVEIPDDVEWEIEEYDGCEWVAEKHRTWQ